MKPKNECNGAECMCVQPYTPIYRGLYTCTLTHTPLRWEVCNMCFCTYLYTCTLTNITFMAGPAVRAKYLSNMSLKESGESRSLFEARVSLFSSVRGGQCQTVSLGSILWGITSGKWRSAVEAVRREADEAKRQALKNALPCFTPSGEFSGLKAADMIAHTGLISIDFDAKDNDFPDFERLKERLAMCPNVVFCARSVSGRGYFCLVWIADPTKHREYFRALCADFKKCGLTVDRSGVDVGRKRFVSYDPEPYINTGAEVYDYTLPEKEPPRAQRLNQEVPEEARHPLLLAILEWADKKGADLTGDYEQWFEMLCALASTFGEGGREYAHRLSKNGHDYEKEDTDKQYDECLKHGGYKYTLATFLHFARKGMGGEEYNRVSAALDFEDMLNDKAEEL